jgi:predicted phosphodiesterase
MRIAIISDIHGNLTALEAVVADLRITSPDLVLHGGDLADGGASPVEVVDYIRSLGWRGVMGNTDEMLVCPASLEKFAAKSSAPPSLWRAIRKMAEVTRAFLGEERLGWLRNLPPVHVSSPVALVHASPSDLWRAPAPDAPDADMEAVFGLIRQPVTVYAHIHRSFVRQVPSGRGQEFTLANTGSVSLSHDGDPRAAYLVVEEGKATIRRVEYDMDKELKAVCSCGLPHADWIARSLAAATPQMP